MEIFNVEIYPKQGFTFNVAFKQRRTREIPFSVILLHVNDHCQMEIWVNKHFWSRKDKGFHIAYGQTYVLPYTKQFVWPGVQKCLEEYSEFNCFSFNVNVA